MNTKANYKTRQSEELLAYLKEMQGRHITVNDITAHFTALSRPISTATVYRRLEKMVNEGLVSKYIIDKNSPACFEYIGSGSHSDKELCFHYKCEKCGRLVHLHCGEFRELCGHLMEHHSFTINPMRTVFYGICGDCRENTDGRTECRP